MGTVAAAIAGAISYLAQMAQWAMIFGGRSSDDERGGNPIAALVMMIVGPIAAREAFSRDGSGMKTSLLRSIRSAKRLVIAVIGFTVLAIGVAMIVLPGPAIVVIPVGLGILATEFVWARTLLKKVKENLQRLNGKAGKT